jgi:uncharacterized membrane protein YkvA (DUF1232 family)
MSEIVEPLDRRQRAAFGAATDAARHVLRRRFRVLRLVRNAYEKAAENEKGVGRVREDLFRLIRLVRAWARREYTVVPWRTLLYIVAALVYFVNPIDLVPDVLVGLGFVDDVAVIAAVVRAVRRDITAFLSWEKEQVLPPPLSRQAA